jgi:GT2 family glycosyltransferase
MHENSTAGSRAKPYAEPAGLKAIQEALNREKWNAIAEASGVRHTYSVRWRVPANQRLAIVICSRSLPLVERCIRSIQATVQEGKYELIVVQHEDLGPNPEMRKRLEGLRARVLLYAGEFNFAFMNNFAAHEATAPNLLFLNDDVYARRAGWCEEIVGQLCRPDVGIAGAVLRYPSGAIQHAGIVLGIGDGVGHPGRFQFTADFWPWLTLTREVSAVTGACLGIRTETFRKLGGFDCRFPNNYNDVDLCLRAGAEGLSVVCVSTSGLVHEECATRAGVTYLRERELFYERWARNLSRPDPFYSPSLCLTEQIGLSGTNANKASFFPAE